MPTIVGHSPYGYTWVRLSQLVFIGDCPYLVYDTCSATLDENGKVPEYVYRICLMFDSAVMLWLHNTDMNIKVSHPSFIDGVSIEVDSVSLSL